ncbi:MAG: trypsin-like peptidase domain-containing protein [Planctomycetota bacterium]
MNRRKNRLCISWVTAMGTLACGFAATVSFADPLREQPVLQDPVSSHVALQQAFRRVADRLRPTLVRVETVGGAQPPEKAVELDETVDKGDEQPGPLPPPKPRSQKPFRDNPGSQFLLADGPTTGIIYRSDGYILTSSFNFVREPTLVSVTLSDGRRLAADLVARDQVRKLALLKIDAVDLPVPTWVSSDDIFVGQWTVALGLGFGGPEPSISVGIVSALNRMAGNAIQVDAKLSPANYGGPICDLRGRILGISVPLAQRPGELAGVELYDAGVGFALPKTRADDIAASLIKGESFYRGWLGMVVDPRRNDAVVVGNVAEPSPMQAAGVKRGDKVLSVAGKDIRNFGQIQQYLYMYPAGQEVNIKLERESEVFEVAIRLARAADLGPLPDIEEPSVSVETIDPTDIELFRPVDEDHSDHDDHPDE